MCVHMCKSKSIGVTLDDLLLKSGQILDYGSIECQSREKQIARGGGGEGGGEDQQNVRTKTYV